VKTESELLSKCREIEGLTLGQLATQLGAVIPTESLQRKGWAGVLIEKALGADAGNQSLPDFTNLGIELKTLPINAGGEPAESTFVTSISLLTLHQQIWETSQCCSKLKRVLWIPIEADSIIPYAHRRIGKGILWSPSLEEESILANDWSELSQMIVLGKLDEIHAGLGTYLQVRPKAANAKSLCHGVDEYGQKILTVPRGFYLRRSFTIYMINKYGTYTE
jgi:DNA mismatch repair protein MutH